MILHSFNNQAMRPRCLMYVQVVLEFGDPFWVNCNNLAQVGKWARTFRSDFRVNNKTAHQTVVVQGFCQIILKLQTLPRSDS